MSEQKITSFYTHDHAQLDKYFQNFQGLKKKDYAQAKENFKKFKFGLQRHIAWEEEILFPLFEEKTGMKDGGPTEVMRQEHRQIEQALEALHKKVQRQDPKSDLEEDLVWDLLKQHNMKEESILYPAIDQSISEKERQNVFGKMNALPEHRYKTCCG
ncbi:MAG: hemerythrin domain-containing protein [Candidatus Omnitrophica bacterium]|nr:hemerythrin domain-containing protein [Candidatus Omnitrophota bacterium]